MGIAIGRLVTRVAAGLRQDGFVRRSSDLLCRDAAGAIAVINFQRSTGWGTPLTFYVNVAAGPAAYFDFLGYDSAVRTEPARGGFGLWRSRVHPTSPAVARFAHGDAVDDMWACHDEAHVELAAAELIAEAHAKVIPTLMGLLNPTVAARAVRHRVPGYHLTMDRRLAEAVLALSTDPADALRRRLADIEGSADPATLVGFSPWFRHAIAHVEPASDVQDGSARTAAPAPDETWFIDDSDPGDDSFADQPGATIRDGGVVGPDGQRATCTVLDRGRNLTVQLPAPAAAIFLGDRTMADVADHVGWGPLTMPPMRVHTGLADQIWVQASRGDATLVVRRSNRADDLVFVQLGGLTTANADAGQPPHDPDWVTVSVVFSDDFLPTARYGTYTELMAHRRVWGGVVATTSQTT